jgi:outer membrane protein assembly factor BamB
MVSIMRHSPVQKQTPRSSKFLSIWKPLLSRIGIFTIFVLLNTIPFAQAEDWPQWRGPDRANKSPETGLLQEWGEGGPRRVWLFENAGSGYSGPAIADGRLYTMGTREDQEIVLALDAETGEELWARPIDRILQNGWGDGPRATPTVDDQQLYVLSGRGKLVCLEAADGNVVWEQNMRDFGGRVPNWGYCESVLIDGALALCTPGGSEGAILALDKKTGGRIWQSKDFTDGAHYASLIISETGGVRQYIQLTQDHLVGVKAETGDLIWRVSFPGRTAVIPTPLFQNDQVFAAAGYNAGCLLVQLDGQGGAEEVYANRNMKNHHGGMVLLDDCVYGYSDNVGWVCLDWETGEIIWRERDALEKGSVTYADGRLYCVGERWGEVALIEATRNGWSERGRFELEPQSEIRSNRGGIWTHPVVSNGKLYLRDQDLIYCYDVKADP